MKGQNDKNAEHEEPKWFLCQKKKPKHNMVLLNNYDNTFLFGPFDQLQF